ncbi:MAG: allantoate amidohydrolase [Actinobacteria bacterium]|nr:allantoate amidohydrolase [Actinomycetota bacterium]
MSAIDLEANFVGLFTALAQIGRHDNGVGSTRLAWTREDLAARAWLTDAADQRGLDVEVDRNGNLWAWWGARDADVVVTGSHLDTVLAGGAYDGALGVVSALTAVDGLRDRGTPLGARSLAVVAFADEEGARFNTPTFGSGLMTGRRDPATVLSRRDGDGVSVGDAMADAGVDPGGVGPDPQRLARIRAVVELHVEQGRHLVDTGHPVALCSGVWPRGRWRVQIDGEANHAGTTRLDERADPMLVLATAIYAARRRAQQGGCRATIGRVDVSPNGASSVASQVTAFLDARAGDDATLDAFAEQWWADVRAGADAQGCRARLEVDSRGAATAFDAELRARLHRRLAPRHPGLPAIATAAGHDAAVLADHVPAAMLFVRNLTGVSHSPAEQAEIDDCLAGVVALTDALEELIGA